MPIAVNDKGDVLTLGQDGQWVPAKKAQNPQTGETLVLDGTEWKPAPKQGGGFMGGLKDFADAASNQFGLGLKDEVQAGGRALTDWAWSKFNPEDQGKGYGEHLAALEQERGEARDRSPVATIAGDVTGAMTSPIMKALTPALTAPTMMGRVLQGARGGAQVGALYGATNAEGGLVDRAIGGAGGAAMGGVVGGVMPPLIEMGSKGASWLANQTINRLPQRQATAANRKLAEALMRDGMTPDQATARVAQLGKEGALIDAGPNTQALGRAVATVPGEGKAPIGDFLRARQEGTRGADMTLQGGQINRVVDAIDNLIPDQSKTIRSNNQFLRKVAGTEYETARGANAVVDVKPVLKSLDDQLVSAKGGIRTGLEKVRSYLVDADGNPETTVDALHQAKMAIDELMSGEAKTSMGRVSKGLIRQAQDDLVTAIETAAPNYRTGRLGTAGAWRVDEALESGEQFMLKRVFSNADDMAAAVAKMSPEEQHAFRVGAAQAIKNKMMDLNTRSDVTKRVMDIPALEQKIRTAFGDQQTFAQYIKGLQNERQMFDTYGKIMGGSRTGEVLAEQSDAAVDPSRLIQGLQRMASPNPVDWAMGGMQALGGIKDRAAMTEPMAKELAKALLSKDASPLNQAYQASQMSAANRAALARALAGGSGAMAGRVQGQ